MAGAPESCVVRIAAELADEKAGWMADFGWVLVEREDRPYTGDVLVERAITLRAEAPAELTRVVVLRFRRAPAAARLGVVEAEFWHPTLVPGWVYTTLTLTRWTALSLPLLALQWIVLLTTVDHGSASAQRLGIRGFVAPIALVWALAAALTVAGNGLLRRLENDPAARDARLRARQAAALREAARLIRAR